MASAIPFVFIFGLIIGSFLNVVGLRWNSGRSLSGRSGCPQCGKKLSWYELIPVISFLLQRGRCRGCKSQISIQYPLVEILTGLVFATIYNTQYTIYKEFNSLFIVSSLLLLIIFSLYIAILIYDFRHKIIPDKLVYSAILLSLVYAFINFQLSTFNFIDLLAGPAIFLFFAGVWFFSRGKAMGFGDAKLGLSIGLLLGTRVGLSAVILAFWIGAGVGLIYMIFGRKKLTMKSEIPFAPFLVLGAWLALIYDLNLLHIVQ